MHERVADEVADDLAQPPVVTEHGGAVLDRRGDLALWVDRARVAHRVLHEHFQPHRCLFERAALVEPREQEQVVDEATHADRFLLGASHRLAELIVGFEPAGAVQLRVAADRRHRRTQLVRRVPDEAPQPVLGTRAFVERLLDAAEHLVERDTELAGLGTRRCLGNAGARSPPAMPDAVAVICLIGRTPRRITQKVTSARTATIAAVVKTSTAPSAGSRCRHRSRVVATTMAKSALDGRVARARGSAGRRRC